MPRRLVRRPRALGGVVLDGGQDEALLLRAYALVERRGRRPRRGIGVAVPPHGWGRRPLRHLGGVVGVRLVLGGHDEPARGATCLVREHDERLGLPIDGVAAPRSLCLSSVLVMAAAAPLLLLLALRSVGICAPGGLGRRDVNAGACSDAWQLRDVEMSPVRAGGGILYVMVLVSARVSTGGLRHGIGVHVRDVHIAVKDYALMEAPVPVEASIPMEASGDASREASIAIGAHVRGSVVSAVVLVRLSVLIAGVRRIPGVMVSHVVIRRHRRKVMRWVLARWVLTVPGVLVGVRRRIIVGALGGAVGRTVSRRGRAVRGRRPMLEPPPVRILVGIHHGMMGRRHIAMIRPVVAPARVVDRPLLALDGRSELLALVRQRRRRRWHPPVGFGPRRTAPVRHAVDLHVPPRRVLVIVPIPPRLVLRRLHRPQNLVVDLAPQQRAAHVGRVGVSREPLGGDETVQGLLRGGVVVRPAVEVGEGGGPLLRVVLGHEGEVVGDVADLPSEEE
mmetsp:Transcript_20056/g.48207  ORF Transcript_20056/g.48207 Transcript_20056/m.48207 type:complete len:506 (+) Transcript_20056:196-1713(+)